MKLEPTSIALAVCCGLMLASPACSLRPSQAASNPPAMAPKPPAQPAPPVEIAAEPPISVPQTQVTLPRPQPIQAEALAKTVPESASAPEPPNQTVKPPRAPAPRPAATTAQAQPAPAPAPAPPPPAVRRLRPVETPAERQRLMAGITVRQRQVQDVLAKARSRQLSEKDKTAVDRIQAFLEQTEAALKDEDLQQAEALSSRALLLCQDLSGEK